jgi:GTP cyclohydrolase I
MQNPEDVIAELLKHLDDQPDREGLRDTPERYTRFLDEFLNPKPFETTIFESEGYDEMVIQTKIPFYSLCEHHLLPFFGHGAIAYIPDKHIVGLSKLSRILDHFSRRLQNQERLTVQVAEFLNEAISPKGVGIILSARHMCMEMRGIRKPETLTTTSALRGRFKTDPRTRAEFIELSK